MFFALKLELLIVAFFVIGCATSENSGASRTASKANQSAQRTPIKCKVLDKDIAGQYSGGCENGFAHGNGNARGRDTYEGEFHKGKKHGRGVYTWPVVGHKYEGYFYNDLRHGWGSYADKNVTYEGEWVDDKKHGKGTTISTNGSKIEEVWLNGQKQVQPSNMVLPKVFSGASSNAADKVGDPKQATVAVQKQFVASSNSVAPNSTKTAGSADGTWEHQGTIWFRCFLGQTWSVDTQRCIGTAKDLPWDQAIKESHALNMLGKKWRLPTQAEMKSNSKLIQTRTNSMGGQFDLFSYAAPEGVFLDINYEVINYPGMPSYRHIRDSLWMLKLSERGGNPVRFLVRKSEFDGLTFNNTNFSRLVVNSNQDFSQIAIANQSLERKKATAAEEDKQRAYKNSPAGLAEARKREQEEEASRRRASENSSAGRSRGGVKDIYRFENGSLRVACNNGNAEVIQKMDTGGWYFSGRVYKEISLLTSAACP